MCELAQSRLRWNLHVSGIALGGRLQIEATRHPQAWWMCAGV